MAWVSSSPGRCWWWSPLCSASRAASSLALACCLRWACFDKPPPVFPVPSTGPAVPASAWVPTKARILSRASFSRSAADSVAGSTAGPAAAAGAAASGPACRPRNARAFSRAKRCASSAARVGSGWTRRAACWSAVVPLGGAGLGGEAPPTTVMVGLAGCGRRPRAGLGAGSSPPYWDRSCAQASMNSVAWLTSVRPRPAALCSSHRRYPAAGKTSTHASFAAFSKLSSASVSSASRSMLMPVPRFFGCTVKYPNRVSTKNGSSEGRAACTASRTLQAREKAPPTSPPSPKPTTQRWSHSFTSTADFRSCETKMPRA
mmetsp:Transcript_102139/g.234021  ORF Transcript_102139/g.234021 Transcript_102139/m.234021 type:complete len:317 (-) Transcript_102139:1156-2106(-)